MAAVSLPYQEPRHYGYHYPYPYYSSYRPVDSHSLANRHSAIETLMTLCQEYVDADEAAVRER